MSIIKSHDIILYGSTGNYDIIMRPLCDEHLPFLYKWNVDPDVLYRTYTHHNGFACRVGNRTSNVG